MLPQSPPEADRTSESRELAAECIDAIRRMIVHYGLWWARVEERLGLDECIAVEQAVWAKTFSIQMGRLAKVLGIPVGADAVPEALRSMTGEQLRSLREALSINWLANDGIWFQAVEERHGMTLAQQCNDAAWARFSPFEAGCIMAASEESSPLACLEAALHRRLYAHINRYTIRQPDDQTLILEMNDCRVQSARKRRGLPDYPCKSGGTVEYTTFANAIDPAITTECLGCPPDPHPSDWYCSWRFST